MSNYFDLQNSPVLTTPSDLTAPKITSIGYPGDDTAADPAGGQTITLTGAGFEAGASVIVNGNAVGVVSVVSSTTITFTSPAQSAGSYPIYVVNTDGGTAIAVPGIQYSGTPNWTTAAGTLGSYTETQAIANTVTATGDAPITYSLFSGSLPTGATLNSANGYISGTSPAAASPTTYTFTIRATDAQQQDTNRQFSLTINPDVVTWSSPANGTTYTSVANTALANVPLSASAASGQNITYTANALPTGLSISGSNITGTPTVVANSSTLLTATAATTNASATRTINWVISVANDPFFPYVTSLLSASTPASTFVTDASTNAFNVTVNGDTRPSNFGPYTPGYYSGLFAGASNQTVTIATAANSNIGAIAGTRITYEYWFYCTTIQAITAWYVGIFGNFQAVAANGRIAFGIRGSSATSPVEAYFYWTTSTSTADIVVTTATVNQNSWNHVAVSIDATTASNSTITIYLNGVGETFTGKNLSTHTTDPGIAYAIGGDYSYQNFTGYLSNFRVTRGATVYSGNFTPSTTPFTANANTVLLALQSNRFIDTSTNAYALTPNSGPQISGFDPFLPSSSYAGYGSGYFSATSAYGRVAMAGADSFGTGDFTVECWLYPSNSAINISMPSVATNSWAILTYGSQLYWSENGGNLGGAGYGTVPLNTWTHLAVARSGSTIRLFVNGVQVYSASNTFNYSGAPATRTIGPGEGGGIPAYISDFRVVKGTAVYTTNFTPPATPLTAVANTSLLTLQNNQPNNNSMFLDGSTNNFNITRAGNTTQGTFSPYGGGWSNFFNGSGDFLTLPSSAAFSMGTGDFTIEAWIYTTSSATQRIVSSTGNNFEFLLVNTGSNVYLNWYDGVGDTTTGSNYVPQNSWVHVAVARSGTALRLFINGVLSGSSTNSVSLPASPTLYIGRYGASGVNLFAGYISNLRILKGTALYTATFTPSTSPLTPIANTSLLTCADNRFIDDSPNNLTVTANGTPSVQRFNPFNPVVTTPTSYSAYFDGTGDGLTITATGVGPVGTQDYTVEFWMYASSLGGNAPRLFEGQGDVGQFQIYLSNGTLYLANSGFNNWLSYNITSLTNQWLHICLTRSGSALRLFVNGVLQSYTTSNVSFSDAGSWIVLNSGGGIIGYQSNLRIVKGSVIPTYNTAVTTTGTTVFTPPTTPLTAVSGTSLLTLQSSTLIDNSTNNYTITGSGNISPRQFNPFGWTTTTGSSAAYTPALYGGSAYFDGVGDFLNFDGGAVTTIGTSSATVEFWMYATANDGYRRIICSTSGGFSSGTFVIRFNQGNLLAGSGSNSVTTATLPMTNRWYHIAWVGVNGSSQTLYIDGVSAGTSTSYNLTESISLIGGWYSVSTSEFFAGYLSDVRIIKGQALYTSNFAPPAAPLTALPNTTLLANMTGAGIYDSSMITTYETAGNAGISTSIKKYGNTSMYFDGTGDYLITPPLIEPYLFRSSANWTIELWFNTTSNSATMGIIDTYYVNAGPYSGLIIRMNSGQISTWDGATNRATTETYNNGAWYHLAWTNSGGTSRIFINGTNVSLGGVTSWATPSNIYRPNAQLQIARLFSGETFNGYIADLRITMGVARYTSNFTPTATPFIAN